MHPLSPEWIHAINILLGHPLTSKVRQHIQKWIIYQANLSYTKFAFKWDPIRNKWIHFLSQVQHSQAICEPKDMHDSADLLG